MKTKLSINHHGTQVRDRGENLKVKTGVRAGNFNPKEITTD
jgi:hypothetical protein